MKPTPFLEKRCGFSAEEAFGLRKFVGSLLLTVPLVLGLFTTLPPAVAISPTVPAFTADDAVAAVIEQHPDFPAKPGGVEKLLAKVGMAPVFADESWGIPGEMTTRVVQNGPAAYLVTFKKQYQLVFHDVPLVSEWTYEVTPSRYKLIHSLDNADRINSVK